jgi:hypothetical protein
MIARRLDRLGEPEFGVGRPRAVDRSALGDQSLGHEEIGAAVDAVDRDQPIMAQMQA